MSDRWWRMAAGAILAFGFGLALLGTVLK